MTDALPGITLPAAQLRQFPRAEEGAEEGQAAPVPQEANGLPYLGRCITLLPPVSGCGSYGQPGMRARVRKIRRCGSSDACAVTLDFSEFEGHNRAFETADWLNDRLITCLTAREAGEYRPIEDYFLPGFGQIPSFMAPFEEQPAAGLYRSFQETGRPPEDYMVWLEERLAEVCPELAGHSPAAPSLQPPET